MSVTNMSGCWAKVERANEHIANLVAETNRFLQVHIDGYRLVGEFDANKREYLLKSFEVESKEPQLARLSIVCGEVIHQLRTSLDHLVWALACKRRGSPPSDKISFPIFDRANQFESAINGQIVKGLSKRLIQIIESVQPYRSPQPAEMPLSVLKRFNDTEKHRLLLVTCGAVVNPRINIDPGGVDVRLYLPPSETVRLRKPTKDGAEVFRFTLDNITPETKVNVDAALQVAIEDPRSRKLELLIPTLVHLRDATVQVLNLFKTEF